MRVLITGCNGQVGHCLVEQLAGHAELLAVDRDQLDITDSVAVDTTVNEFKPDIIINAAAHTAVDKAEEEAELSYAINRDGPKYIAQAAANVGAAILHISTDYVFAGNKDGLYVENDETEPQGIYGQSKLAGEKAVIEACSKHIILRTAWVFGQHGNNFVKTMLRLAKDRDTLGIVGDQVGGPTCADDIASALITIAKQVVSGKNAQYGVYHFSGMPHVSWFEFAQTIFEQAEEQELLSSKPRLNSIATADYPTPAKRPANSKLDTKKIEQAFNIQPSDWRSALTDLKPYTN
ncbi:dTDP-4-dehydrorhamnose reductase [Photobacterium proteolyticum]|uniref:dTDP-4-dehydrorhamnose reductase n=1 Tax=Photobacterium proteolyticum TaxID=1903952 RepID=A0A1Q9GN67_9GAMM|nr:dTDP-4-dehydrorhamnose reductase [Photobacterium proteolyticum]OLQ76095.1 dTDP-4-dehydrorhamnose reductase [Photobacterium proteolyticum]